MWVTMLKSCGKVTHFFVDAGYVFCVYYLWVQHSRMLRQDWVKAENFRSLFAWRIPKDELRKCTPVLFLFPVLKHSLLFFTRICSCLLSIICLLTHWKKSVINSSKFAESLPSHINPMSEKGSFTQRWLFRCLPDKLAVEIDHPGVWISTYPLVGAMYNSGCFCTDIVWAEPEDMIC